MPLFNDLKKIFFGAKSVAKHQGQRAADAAREAGEELSERAPEMLERGKDALSELGDRVWEEAGNLADKGRELRDDASDALNERLRTTPPETERAGDIIDDTLGFDKLDLTPRTEAPKSGSPAQPLDFEDGLGDDAPPREPGEWEQAANNALDRAARTGLDLKDAAGAAAGRVGEVSERLGRELLDKGGEALDRAGDFVDHANRKAEKMRMDDAIADARAAADRAEARARAFDGKEAARDTSDSTLSGTDSFFDRADRFAQGDYTNEGGKDMTIGQAPEGKPRKPAGGLLPGFDDHDGDGDSLIDDAIIEEE